MKIKLYEDFSNGDNTLDELKDIWINLDSNFDIYDLEFWIDGYS